MPPPNRPPANTPTPRTPPAEPALAVETERLRTQLRLQRPSEFALLAGGVYAPHPQATDTGKLSLKLWGETIDLDFPELVARREALGPLPLPFQALLMFYLATTDGLASAGEWVSFSDLPGGRMYAQAFQGYSGHVLTRTFGEDVAAFQSACLKVGGVPVELGDAAFAFAGLPRVPLMVTYWQGEDEIPSTAQVLFDRSATHHLPVDVCAIMGSMLVSRILKANPTQA